MTRAAKFSALLCQLGLFSCGGSDSPEQPTSALQPWNAGMPVNADIASVPGHSTAGSGYASADEAAASGQVFDTPVGEAQSGAADADAGPGLAVDFPQSGPVDFETAVLALYNLFFGPGGLLEALRDPNVDREQLLAKIVEALESADLDDAGVPPGVDAMNLAEAVAAEVAAGEPATPH